MQSETSSKRFNEARAQLEARTQQSAQASRRASRSLAMEVVQTVVMPHPIYIESAEAGRLTDVDGNEYIDLTAGFGPNVLGNRPNPFNKHLLSKLHGAGTLEFTTPGSPNSPS
ncbi:MAG: hypothetical protein P8M78_06750 [Myxococcota bacterium]|nr:hypothetical protein [Myxococcota bacterium]